MQHGTSISFRIGAVALAAWALTACSDEAVSPEALAVDVYVCPESQDPFEDVDVLRVTVTGSDLEEPVVAETPYAPNGSLQVPQIPDDAAFDRQVVVEGLATVGDSTVTVSRGVSVPTKVDSGAEEPAALSILLSRTNSFLPVTDPVGNKQSLSHGRVGHTVTYTDRNEVVIAGGGTVADDGVHAWWDIDSISQTLDSVDIVDEPTMTVRNHATGLVQEVEEGVYRVGRVFHTATALPTGQVFFAGGYGGIDGQPEALSTIDVYDPGPDGTILTLSNSMVKPRVGHTATLIDDDDEAYTVLFVGGDVDGSFTYETWNPYGYTSGAKTIEGLPTRRNHTATLFTIPVGESKKPFVLVAGGESDTEVLDSLFIYDIDSDEVILHPGTLPKGARTAHTATFVENDELIYLIGGFTNIERTQVSAAIDVYISSELDLAKSFHSATSEFNLTIPRGGHATVMMPGDAILVTGGQAGGGATHETVEIIHEYLKPKVDDNGEPVLNEDGQQIAEPTIKVSTTCYEAGCVIPGMLAPRTGHDAVYIERGLVLTAGGVGGTIGSGINHISSMTLYNPQ